MRANHFMRTSHLNQWAKHAEIFDQTIRGATEAIIKRPLPNDAYDQACVSTRFGGLGIRKVTEHAPVAFKASYVTSRRQCGEQWLNSNSIPDDASCQRSGSERIDRATLDRLIAHGSERDKQRIRRLDCKHANSWITALPCTTDGKDTIMPSKIFTTAVARLLGLPFTLILPNALFVSKPWIFKVTTLCAAKGNRIILRDTIGCEIGSASWRTWVC
jgi:hypothetical protein